MCGHDAKSWVVQKILCPRQWTSSGKSPNVKAEGFAWKKIFQDLSLCLSFFQSVSEAARGSYFGHEKRAWSRVCSVPGPQVLQKVGSFGWNLRRYSPVRAWFVKVRAIQLMVVMSLPDKVIKKVLHDLLVTSGLNFLRFRLIGIQLRPLYAWDAASMRQ